MKNVFETTDYQSDKYKFYFVEKNRFLDNAYVMTDNENYAAVQGNLDMPLWVWTKEGLSLDKLRELSEVLNKFLVNDKLQVTTRKEVYDYLKSTKYKYLDCDSYFEMGYLECSNLLKPKECGATVTHFTESDYETLAHYYYLDQNEMGLNSNVTMEYAYEHVKSWLNNDRFYGLKNNDGKLVCMLSHDVFEDCAKLGNVYTPKEERRKGYCVNLVYYVTNELLKHGYKPMLYTDYNYQNSNKAYKKVGYQDLGFLVNYTLKK